MNPYLEHPALWPEVHNRLIVAMADALNPQILPKYRAAIDQRVYRLDGNEALLVGIPDVAVERRTVGASGSQKRPGLVTGVMATPLSVTVPMPVEVQEFYLEIREVATQDVVTAVEVLSPSNKQTRAGRAAYEAKRFNVLGSSTHLVEIDLLRVGVPMPLVNRQEDFDYRILVSRFQERPGADLYGFNLPDQIPAFPLPLREPDREPVVDLKALLDQVYDRGGYEVVIDYGRSPTPPLAVDQNTWLDSWLKTQGLR
jgi:hypothetical protein